MNIPLPRRPLAEFLGAAFLAAVVIGAGIAAQRLSPHDTGLELFEVAAATAGGLFAIILMFGPVSRAGTSTPRSRSPTPPSVPGFIAAELVGCGLAILAIRALYPDVTPAEASRIVVPQVEEHAAPDGAASQSISR